MEERPGPGEQPHPSSGPCCPSALCPMSRITQEAATCASVPRTKGKPSHLTKGTFPGAAANPSSLRGFLATKWDLEAGYIRTKANWVRGKRCISPPSPRMTLRGPTHALEYLPQLPAQGGPGLELLVVRANALLASVPCFRVVLAAVSGPQDKGAAWG